MCLSPRLEGTCEFGARPPNSKKGRASVPCKFDFSIIESFREDEFYLIKLLIVEDYFMIYKYHLAQSDGQVFVGPPFPSSSGQLHAAFIQSNGSVLGCTARAPGAPETGARTPQDQLGVPLWQRRDLLCFGPPSFAFVSHWQWLAPSSCAASWRPGACSRAAFVE